MRTPLPGIAAAALALLVMLSGCTAASPDAPEALLDGEVTVLVEGGHETDPVDSGRPVVLIAAALGVPTEVFREAFSGVSSAGAGEEVDEERATANKAVLLGVLAPYGVSSERLDEVSNFYRYVESAGQLWSHRDASGVAVVENGVVTSITVTEAGFGYSSAPTVTLPTGQSATVELEYGTDLGTNGSIARVVLE
jgi:hypothetical protein